MNYIDRCYITLDSMGVELDSRMQYDFPGVKFIPSVGCTVYNPSGHTIDTYVSQSGDTWTISSRPVSNNDLYFNLRTGRAYTWNGTEMVNAHLTPNVSAGIPICDHDFSLPNSTYYVSETIALPSTQPITIGSGSTIEFYGNGCFNGCKLIGCNIRIIPHGTQQIFKDCSFELDTSVPDAEYLFVDSQLYATNFGAISDMHTVEMDEEWRFKGLAINKLKVHCGYTQNESGLSQFTGKINDVVWDKMAAFLKKSNGISIEFNGNFMGEQLINIVISNSHNLELFGGTMLRGFDIVDCHNVEIHDMRFVGVHEVHDFPTILVNKAQYIANLQQQLIDNPSQAEAINQELEHATNQTYDCNYSSDVQAINVTGLPTQTPTLVSCGLSGGCISVQREDAEFPAANVLIHDCHFEMRQNGVGFNSKFGAENGILTTYLPLSHCTIRDCTFSHIYYQPVGSHAEHVAIENIQSEYCMQGLDISTCANNTVVRNCVFRKCASGPKQETYDPYTPLTHDNVVENCLFEMTDDYLLTNTSRYVLCVNKGLVDDTFIMRNCEFTVDSAKKFDGMFFRSWRALLENVKFKIDIDCGTEVNYDILYLIGMGGATPHSPIVEMSHIDIECNARLESLVFRGVSLNQAGPLQLRMDYVHLHGSGHVTQMFEQVENMTLNKCQFDLAANSFVRYSHTVTVSKCLVKQIANSGFIAYTILDTDYLIEDSVFEVGSRFLWIQSTGGEIVVRRNKVKCSIFVACKWDGSASVEISNNDITDMSTNAYLLFNAVSGQPAYNYWTDGGQSELIFTNNVVHYPGSGIKSVVYSGQYPDYAHLFYCDFLCRGVKQFNTGTSGERPTTPWQGMLHLESGTYHFYDENDGWS